MLKSKELMLRPSKFDLHKINQFLLDNPSTAHLISWDADAFSTGLEDVDNQHMGMIELINEIYHVLRVGKRPKSYIKSIFMKLQTYCDEHFKFEENLMLQTNFPGYTLHKTRHDNFSASISELRKRYFYDILDLREIFAVLIGWLVHHIAIEDRLFGKFFIETQISCAN